MADNTAKGGDGEVDTISEGGNRSENNPIVNSILTFCVSILLNSTQKKIIELISTHFCVDEIKQAKTVLCDLVNEEFQERRSTDLRTDKYAHSQDMVNILKKIDKKCMPYFVIDSYGLVKLPRINPEDLSFYAVSEKLAELTTKFNILCMEVHDNTAHIKLNENSIVSYMGNDGEGSTKTN